METYSLRLITKWLSGKQIGYTYSNARVGMGFVNHGIRVDIATDTHLSVQTHPDVACSFFAETALFYKNRMVPIFEYEWDVARWSTPDDLYTHIFDLRRKLSAYSESHWLTILNACKNDEENSE